jgi:SAM-dependent methyltransferase
MTDNILIDVRQLITERPVEEHSRAAEDYFARLIDLTHHLSKPFGTADETPQLLVNFAIVLQGLSLCPGMTVLEFGAGTCWAAHALTQLGCRVIAADVSPSALRIGQELYARHPPFGDKPAPQFLLFDGHRLELPDQSIDRVICLDSLHHVPNPDEVLRELGRVLVEGGIGGFAEPGPEHSKTAQSQYEMRKHGVIENDIDIREVWRAARTAGFTDLKLAIFNTQAFHLGIGEFEDFLAGGKIGRRYVDAARESLQNQRTFFLFKGESPLRDSRYRLGLSAAIEVSPAATQVKESEAIKLRARIKNTSDAIWLPRSAGLGAVLLGCHVYRSGGEVYRESFHWEALTPGDGEPIKPGESVDLEVHLPSLPHGSYQIEFDMVSNDVCWFAINGSQTPRINIDVI